MTPAQLATYAEIRPVEARRDALRGVLTLMYARLTVRGRSAPPDAWTRYWTLQAEWERLGEELQARLLGVEGEDPADPYPLCPECEGSGWIPWQASYFDPPEADSCPVCGGAGELAPPYGRTEEE